MKRKPKKKKFTLKHYIIAVLVSIAWETGFIIWAVNLYNPSILFGPLFAGAFALFSLLIVIPFIYLLASYGLTVDDLFKGGSSTANTSANKSGSDINIDVGNLPEGSTRIVNDDTGEKIIVHRDGSNIHIHK